MSRRASATKCIERFRFIDRMKQLDASARGVCQSSGLAKRSPVCAAFIANRYENVPDSKGHGRLLEGYSASRSLISASNSSGLMGLLAVLR